jgi:hypothetical protein
MYLFDFFDCKLHKNTDNQYVISITVDYFECSESYLNYKKLYDTYLIINRNCKIIIDCHK